MARKATDPVKRLIQTAEAVWQAYLNYGPVDDGRPEGTAFDAALTALMEAKVEARYHKRTKAKRVPLLIINVCCCRSPGGRGKNAVHWRAWANKESVLQHVRGNSRELVVGKVLEYQLRGSFTAPRVIVNQVQEENVNWRGEK